MDTFTHDIYIYTHTYVYIHISCVNVCEMSIQERKGTMHTTPSIEPSNTPL